MQKNKFAQRLALIRKKSGLSQKQAAEKLGISQGLLSHYERGIRECGLDFVLKVSKVFDVSCDYLLGSTENERNEKLSKKPKLYLGRNNLQNAIDLLYSITARFGNPKIHLDINNLMYAQIYSDIRLLHSILTDDDMADIFSLPYNLALSRSEAMRTNSMENAIMKMIEAEKISLSKADLKAQYPMNYNSIMSIIETVENIR